jgi:hypothetical protein
MTDLLEHVLLSLRAAYVLYAVNLKIVLGLTLCGQSTGSIRLGRGAGLPRAADAG